MQKYLNLKANVIFSLVFIFLANICGPLPAQAMDFSLPAPGMMVPLSAPFNPPILKGIKVHPNQPFKFDFILDQGDTHYSQAETTKLIKYFLASLTTPEQDLWVNLSPYEKNRIIPQSFGLTEMGRDLLAEDYMLKQITSSLIYPEGNTGKKFWARVYAQATQKFGTTNIPINTFNKVWIVPQKAVVYENAKAGTAYVVDAKLKVMLEEDYLSAQKHGSDDHRNSIGSDILRQIVIPELNHEVNYGQNFAQLRQVYNSLVLATWYKKKIKDSILSQVYADKKKVVGVEPLVSLRGAAGDAAISDTEYIYQRYLQAFKKGVYNYIKDDIDPATQQSIPRKYFSGGADLAMLDKTHLGFGALSIRDDVAVLSAVTLRPLLRIGLNLKMSFPDAAMLQKRAWMLRLASPFFGERSGAASNLARLPLPSDELINSLINNLINPIGVKESEMTFKKYERPTEVFSPELARRNARIASIYALERLFSRMNKEGKDDEINKARRKIVIRLKRETARWEELGRPNEWRWLPTRGGHEGMGVIPKEIAFLENIRLLMSIDKPHWLARSLDVIVPQDAPRDLSDGWAEARKLVLAQDEAMTGEALNIAFYKSAEAQYLMNKTFFDGAPVFQDSRSVLKWYYSNLQRLPHTAKGSRVIASTHVATILFIAGKIDQSRLQDFQLDVGAYEYAKGSSVIQEAPSFGNVDDLIQWYEDNKPKLTVKRKQNGKSNTIGLEYAVRVLSMADKIEPSEFEAFRRASYAYESSIKLPLIQNAPSFSDVDAFFVWYESHRSEFVSKAKPRRNSNLYLSPSTVISFLFYAGKISVRKRRVFQVNANAYEYARESPVVQKAPVFSEAVDFIRWYRTNCLELISRDDPSEHLKISYAATVLFYANKISKKDLENYQFSGAAYERALENRSVIEAEIRRIWASLPTKRYGSDLVRLKRQFDPIKLPNLKEKGRPKPLSDRYRNLILGYAYDLYGAEIIAKMQLPTPEDSNAAMSSTQRILGDGAMNADEMRKDAKKDLQNGDYEAGYEKLLQANKLDGITNEPDQHQVQNKVRNIALVLQNADGIRALVQTLEGRGEYFDSIDRVTLGLNAAWPNFGKVTSIVSFLKNKEGELIGYAYAIDTPSSFIPGMDRVFYSTVDEIRKVNEFDKRIAYESYYISHWFVRPDYQGKGLGFVLIHNLILAAQQKGIRYLTGTTFPENIEILRQGFPLYVSPEFTRRNGTMGQAFLIDVSKAMVGTKTVLLAQQPADQAMTAAWLQKIMSWAKRRGQVDDFRLGLDDFSLAIVGHDHEFGVYDYLRDRLGYFFKSFEDETVRQEFKTYVEDILSDHKISIEAEMKFRDLLKIRNARQKIPAIGIEYSEEELREPLVERDWLKSTYKDIFKEIWPTDYENKLDQIMVHAFKAPLSLYADGLLEKEIFVGIDSLALKRRAFEYQRKVEGVLSHLSFTGATVLSKFLIKLRAENDTASPDLIYPSEDQTDQLIRQMVIEMFAHNDFQAADIEFLVQEAIEANAQFIYWGIKKRNEFMVDKIAIMPAGSIVEVGRTHAPVLKALLERRRIKVSIVYLAGDNNAMITVMGHSADRAMQSIVMNIDGKQESYTGWDGVFAHWMAQLDNAPANAGNQIVLIGGQSSTGKTTTTTKFVDFLRSQGRDVALIRLNRLVDRISLTQMIAEYRALPFVYLRTMVTWRQKFKHLNGFLDGNRRIADIFEEILSAQRPLNLKLPANQTITINTRTIIVIEGSLSGNMLPQLPVTLGLYFDIDRSLQKIFTYKRGLEKKAKRVQVVIEAVIKSSKLLRGLIASRKNTFDYIIFVKDQGRLVVVSPQKRAIADQAMNNTGRALTRMDTLYQHAHAVFLVHPGTYSKQIRIYKKFVRAFNKVHKPIMVIWNLGYPFPDFLKDEKFLRVEQEESEWGDFEPKEDVIGESAVFLGGTPYDCVQTVIRSIISKLHQENKIIFTAYLPSTGLWHPVDKEYSLEDVISEIERKGFWEVPRELKIPEKEIRSDNWERIFQVMFGSQFRNSKPPEQWAYTRIMVRFNNNDYVIHEPTSNKEFDLILDIVRPNDLAMRAPDQAMDVKDSYERDISEALELKNSARRDLDNISERFDELEEILFSVRHGTVVIPSLMGTLKSLLADLEVLSGYQEQVNNSIRQTMSSFLLLYLEENGAMQDDVARMVGISSSFLSQIKSKKYAGVPSEDVRQGFLKLKITYGQLTPLRDEEIRLDKLNNQGKRLFLKLFSLGLDSYQVSVLSLMKSSLGSMSATLGGLNEGISLENMQEKFFLFEELSKGKDLEPAIRFLKEEEMPILRRKLATRIGYFLREWRGQRSYVEVLRDPRLQEILRTKGENLNPPNLGLLESGTYGALPEGVIVALAQFYDKNILSLNDFEFDSEIKSLRDQIGLYEQEVKSNYDKIKSRFIHFLIQRYPDQGRNLRFAEASGLSKSLIYHWTDVKRSDKIDLQFIPLLAKNLSVTQEDLLGDISEYRIYVFEDYAMGVQKGGIDLTDQGMGIENRIKHMEDWIHTHVAASKFVVFDMSIGSKLFDENDELSVVGKQELLGLEDAQSIIKITFGPVNYKRILWRRNYARIGKRFLEISRALSAGLWGGSIPLELLKNAYVHGNEMNNELPIYLQIDPVNHVVSCFDFDFPQTFLSRLERIRSKPYLHGEGYGISHVILPAGDFEILDVKDADTVLGKQAKVIVQAKYSGLWRDRAMRGGIDLTRNKLPLEIKQEIASSPSASRNDMPSVGIKFHLDPAQLAALQNATGVLPIIISVEPLQDLRGFLGAPAAH